MARKPTKRQKARPPKDKQIQVTNSKPELVKTESDFLKDSPSFNDLGDSDQTRLKQWLDWLKDYTKGEFSEPEYYNLATLMLQIEKRDKILDILDFKMCEEHRKSKETVNNALAEYRTKNRSKKSNALDQVKAMFANVQTKDGRELEVSVREKPLPLIIDVKAEVVDLDSPDNNA